MELIPVRQAVVEGFKILSIFEDGKLLETIATRKVVPVQSEASFMIPILLVEKGYVAREIGKAALGIGSSDQTIEDIVNRIYSIPRDAGKITIEDITQRYQ